MKKRAGCSRGNSSPDDSGTENQGDASTLANTNTNATSNKSGATSVPTTPTKQRSSSSISRDKELDEYAETFVIVNERPVDDISLDFFYKPHTITLFAISVLSVMFFAFVR